MCFFIIGAGRVECEKLFVMELACIRQEVIEMLDKRHDLELQVMR